MFNIIIIIYLIVLFILLFLLGLIIYENKMNNDLLFFTLSNFILSFSLICFLFYFKDYLFSLVNMFLLFFNTIFLCYEIKNTFNKYRMLAIPYFIYIVYIFYLIIDLCLMYQ